ncbi:hypothetical protein NPIL_365251 [Nephila pilipes]|uniref:Uncharacterized protein n=1 Tax=Nephila pilipes TaxID=299642 RepID=A0A8X6QUY9_NEPPI|nr:hypothetical protein NPIL_365251 [Nephila pilipes]
MVLTIKQRDFNVQCYVKHNLRKKCTELFVQESKNGRGLAKSPAKSTMQNLVVKWWETGSLANKNRNFPKRARTPENITQVNRSMEKTPTKSPVICASGI